MSLSDKFYEGLSAPLPVAGAQMPMDLVPYAGSPLDALEQHKQKYKQIDYMNRLSDQASKRLLKQLADAETEYEGVDMDKVSFVGSNPVSRRAYYLQKLAENPPPVTDSATVVPPPVTDPSVTDSATVVPPPVTDSATVVPSPVTDSATVVPPPVTDSATVVPPPVTDSATVVPPPVTDTNSFGQRYNQGGKQQRFLGENQRDLVNSGEFLNRSREMAAAFKGMKKDPRYIGPTREPEDTRSFFERAKDNLYHYGTRAARGLSTGAQMGASYLYDLADRNHYLDEGSFLGDALGQSGRQSLNQEMAHINASLGHAYGGQGEDAKLYFDRLRGIDTDLDTEGIQAYDNLSDRAKFRKELVKDRMRGYSSRGFNQNQLDALRRSAGETIDNYYGFEGNTAGTPSLRDDITGTSFRNALSEIRDGSLFTTPAKEQARIATLEEMMRNNPDVYNQIKNKFGEAATKANVPLAQYAASQLAKGLQFGNPASTQGGYEQTRQLTTSVLDSMGEQDRGRFLAQMNPRAVQRAQNISQMSDDKALATINDMDPLEARYILDQYALLSKYVSPNMKQTTLDPSKYRVLEDRDDWLPSFGGTDLVNPALQQIGAGSDLGDMTGDARDSVYFYNNMREQPTASGQSYLVDDGWLGNTYYNPITRETNYEFGTDLGRLFSNTPTTHTVLPEKYRKQFYKQEGYYPTYTGREK